MAVLLVDAGRPVSAATLVHRVWGEKPPPEALNALYSHLSRIRNLLAEGAVDGILLERRQAGYVLRTDPDSVDLHRFRRLAEWSIHPGRTETEQAATAAEALSLWRGAPMAGLSGEWVEAVRDDYEQLRLRTAIRWARAELALGHSDAILDALPAYIAEYPLAEPLEAVLIEALRASGRAAEALDRYAKVRRRLSDALGSEPGQELQALHQSILEGERRSPATPASPVTRPAQLPLDIAGFVGRERELRELDRLLDASGPPSSAVVISSVCGSAGIGKTALAVRWGHQAASRFPDGQLYLNLRGYGPVPAMTPHEALAILLQALGVVAEQLPPTEEGRSGLYRSLLDGRRMLVILDNARGAEQIRPLLPGSPTCAVVVTSRADLPGLTALHGARRVALAVLGQAEAEELLTRLIGNDRIAAEPTAAAEIARLCAYLPLALRIAAALLIRRPEMPIAVIADRLANGDRIAQLTVDGDSEVAVGAAFDLSYEALDIDARRLFRRLGLIPGSDFDVHAAAHLTDVPVEEAERLLDRLADANLVEPYAAERFRFHDLLRLYADHRSRLDDPPAERQACLRRLYGYYRSRSAAALHLVQPAVWLLGQGPDDPGVRPPRFTDRVAALTWFETERGNIVAALVAAGKTPQPHTWELAESFGKYLWISGCGEDALDVCQAGLTAARHAGNPRAEIILHTLIAGAQRSVGRPELTVRHLTEAGTLARRIGDLSMEAIALIGLGTICRGLARLREAEQHLRQALALHERLESPDLPVTRLYLGLVLQDVGELDDAETQLSKALAEFDAADDRHRIVLTCSALARVCRAGKRLAEAMRYAERAHRVARDTGLPVIEAGALLGLADACLDRDLADEALTHARAAARIADSTANRRLEGQARTTLAEIHSRLGDHGDAAEHARAAVSIHREMGRRLYEARTLCVLGHAVRRLDGVAAAREHWQQAHDLYAAAGSRQAEQLRELLAVSR